LLLFALINNSLSSGAVGTWVHPIRAAYCGRLRSKLAHLRHSVPGDGSYAIKGLSPGNYSVMVSQTGYATFTGTLAVTSGIANRARIFALIPTSSPSAASFGTSISTKYSGGTLRISGRGELSRSHLPRTVIGQGHPPPGIVRFITPRNGSTDIATGGNFGITTNRRGNCLWTRGQLQVLAIGGDGSSSIAGARGFVVNRDFLYKIWGAFQVVDPAVSLYYQSQTAAGFNSWPKVCREAAKWIRGIPRFGGHSIQLGFFPHAQCNHHGRPS